MRNQETLCLKDIFPAFDTNNVPIIFESSDLFAPYLSVAILSVLNTASDKANYDIVILSNEISKEDQRCLCKLAEGKSNFSIRFFDPTDLVQSYIDNARYSYLYLNYYRMSLPWILKHYTKVINLGVDVLVKRDIADLFNEDIGENYLGGVIDLGYQGRLTLDISPKELGMDTPTTYINADVLVFNLEKIRNGYNQEKLMQVWQDRQFRCAEQDTLNVVFQNNIHHFNLKWNVFPRKMSSEYDIMHASSETIAVWQRCLKDPYIIHFAAVPKPWQLPTVEFGVDWWIVAQHSPYYSIMLQHMCDYIEQHGEFEIIESRARKLLRKYAPRGSVRALLITKLCPKGSKQWCIMKKLYYAIYKDEHNPTSTKNIGG